MVINKDGEVLDPHEAALEMLRLLNERRQNKINREEAERERAEKLDHDNRTYLQRMAKKRYFKSQKGQR